jgi:hypothetical protein
MDDCQMPNGGCLRDDESGACPLCDEDGADRIAEWYSKPPHGAGDFVSTHVSLNSDGSAALGGYIQRRI